MKDMLETMYKAPGIGLAAIQLGILKRLVVIDISKTVKKSSFSNQSRNNFKSKTSTFEEGQVITPGQYAEIEPAECHLQYLDFHGKKEIKADGLLSTCIQHEVDHLDGVLFIDYLSKLKDMIVKN